MRWLKTGSILCSKFMKRDQLKVLGFVAFFAISHFTESNLQDLILKGQTEYKPF
jgi:hypothetical protein